MQPLCSQSASISIDPGYRPYEVALRQVVVNVAFVKSYKAMSGSGAIPAAPILIFHPIVITNIFFRRGFLQSFAINLGFFCPMFLGNLGQGSRTSLCVDQRGLEIGIAE